MVAAVVGATLVATVVATLALEVAGGGTTVPIEPPKVADVWTSVAALQMSAVMPLVSKRSPC